MTSFEKLLSHRARLPSFWSTVAAPAVPTISFGGGVPDPSSLPIKELRKAIDEVLELEPAAALQYGGGYGFEGLRQVLAERAASSEGLEIVADWFVITSGSSQALQLVCSTLLDPGDMVLVERPSFSGSLWTIRTHEAQIVGIPVDAQGMQVEVLEATLKKLAKNKKQPKFLYTIPDFHNPTGATLSLERRHALVALAKRYELLIVEDIAYRELRYDGVEPPSLFSVAQGQGVIQMGTFSKVMASGLRLGWAMAEPSVVAHLVGIRTDMGTSPFLARVVARYLQVDSFSKHLEEVRAIYSHKLNSLVQALEEHCPEEFQWTKPEGGFFLWLQMSGGGDALALLRRGYQEGVSFVPGANFYSDKPERDKVRLAFSFLSPAEIQEGVHRLSRAVSSMVGQPKDKETI